MKLKHSSYASWKVVDEEGVILHLKSGNYYSLNELGLKIWTLCDGKRDAEAIQERIAADYPSQPKRVRRDVDQFLKKLCKERLLEKRR